jgi:hypothetical protein
MKKRTLLLNKDTTTRTLKQEIEIFKMFITREGKQNKNSLTWTGILRNS